MCEPKSVPGSLRLRAIPERGDVLYGITPVVADFYARAHARSTYHVVSQEIPVSAQEAERLLSRAKSEGPVAAAFCAYATSSLIRQLPGFEDVQVTFFPVNLQEQLEGRAGVVTTRYYENDAGGVVDGIPAAQL